MSFSDINDQYPQYITKLKVLGEGKESQYEFTYHLKDDNSEYFPLKRLKIDPESPGAFANLIAFENPEFIHVWYSFDEVSKRVEEAYKIDFYRYNNKLQFKRKEVGGVEKYEFTGLKDYFLSTKQDISDSYAGVDFFIRIENSGSDIKVLFPVSEFKLKDSDEDFKKYGIEFTANNSEKWRRKDI